jgi:hypothetical protein
MKMEKPEQGVPCSGFCLEALLGGRLFCPRHGIEPEGSPIGKIPRDLPRIVDVGGECQRGVAQCAQAAGMDVIVQIQDAGCRVVEKRVIR